MQTCAHCFFGGTQTVAWNVGFRRKVGRRTGRAALSMATEPRLQCWCARSKLQPRLFSTTAPKLSASCSALLCALYPEAEASMTVTCSSSLPLFSPFLGSTNRSSSMLRGIGTWMCPSSVPPCFLPLRANLSGRHLSLCPSHRLWTNVTDSCLTKATAIWNTLFFKSGRK